MLYCNLWGRVFILLRINCKVHLWCVWLLVLFLKICFYFIIIFMNMRFYNCMYICVPCLVPTEARGTRIADTWVLGIEPVFSERTTNALNHSAISLDCCF